MKLQNVLEDFGFQTLNASARGMMGKCCLAVVMPKHISLILLGFRLHSVDEIGIYTILGNVKIDDSGKEDMIVYFPDVEYEELR